AAAGSGALPEVVLRVPVALGTPRDVQVVRQEGALRLSSRLADQAGDQSWLTHSLARVADPDGGRPEPVPPSGLAEVLDPDCVMDRLRTIGVVGIGFPWQAREGLRSGEPLLVRVAADPDPLMGARAGGSPVDAGAAGSLFAAGLSAAPIVFPGPPRLRMPGRLREVAVYGGPPPEALVSVRLVDVQWAGGQADDAEVDVTIADPDGAVLARLSGV